MRPTYNKLLSVHSVSRSEVDPQHLGVHRDRRGQTSALAGLGPQGEPGLPPPHRPQLLRQLLHLPLETREARGERVGTADLTLD